MDAVIGNGQSAEPAGQVKSVAAGILGGFFEALAKEDGLSDVAAALRKTVLDEGIFAEPAIRTAMFPDAS